MHFFPGTMRDEEDGDPKKPQPVTGGRKGDNASEAQEHGPSEVGPDGKSFDIRYHHMHVHC